MTDDNRMARRQLVKGLAVASTAFALESFAPSQLSADEKSADEKKKRAEQPSEEFLLLNYIMRRYPSDQFDEVAIRGIHGDLRSDAARSRVLSEFPLKNSDEPCLLFRAFRSPD